MKRRTALAIFVPLCQIALYFVAVCPAASAQNQYGIQLKPGERLVSVNGVAVNQSAVNQGTGATRSTTASPPAANGSRPSGSVSNTSMYGGSDQQRAQAEANYMAQNGIKGHVGGQIGSFEGCGWSSGGTPNTCTPGGAMRLTADATAHGRDGAYRVRAWR